MEIVKDICKNVALATGAVSTALAASVLGEVDFGNLGTVREFCLTAKLTGNGTDPGASRTVTFSLLWSDEKLTAAQVVAQGMVYHVSEAFPIATGVNAISRGHVRFLDGSGAFVPILLRPLARWLYVIYTKTTEGGGAVTTIERLALHKIRAARG